MLAAVKAVSWDTELEVKLAPDPGTLTVESLMLAVTTIPWAAVVPAGPVRVMALFCELNDAVMPAAMKDAFWLIWVASCDPVEPPLIVSDAVLAVLPVPT